MRDRGFSKSRQLLAVLLQRAANRDGDRHRRVVRALHVSRLGLAPLARARDVRQGKLIAYTITLAARNSSTWLRSISASRRISSVCSPSLGGTRHIFIGVSVNRAPGFTVRTVPALGCS